MPSAGFDLIITATEINDHHGVGILLQRLFPDSASFVSLRTTSLYGSETGFGAHHHELCSRALTTAATRAHLEKILSPYPIRRIVCVPYYREEFVHATLAHELTGAPVCTYLMDDQNVFSSAVPDHWVARLLAITRLCLGISPELCTSYAHKYRREVHLLPPILTRLEPALNSYWQPSSTTGEPLRLAMIGNVWTARRFERLRQFVRTIGAQLFWYGNGSQASWLPGRPADWLADGIVCMGYLPEEDLVAALGAYPFVVLPSGSLDAGDDNQAFSRLSLPSRLLFLHAKVTTPVVVLGSEETAAGRFVMRSDTGLCVRDEDAFRAALPTLLSPEWQAHTSANIRQLAPQLVLAEPARWIWDSLSAGAPVSAQFTSPVWTLRDSEAHFTALIDPPAPAPDAGRVPEPGTPLSEIDAPSLSFLRHAHLPYVQHAGWLARDLTDPTPGQLAGALLGAALEDFVPHAKNVLFLGETIPPALSARDRANTPILWQVLDLAAWSKLGFPGDPGHFCQAVTREAHAPAFPQFDAIVSNGWLNSVPDDYHSLEGLSLFLAACTVPGGMNLHYFDATLQEAQCWTPAAYRYLKARLGWNRKWPGPEEMLASPDAFFMSEANYQRLWFPRTQQPYARFGRPLSFGLYWRKQSAS